MATILNDAEIQKLIEFKVIAGGDKASVRPNSYVLRLGSVGEFLNAGKDFEIGEGPKEKKGIRVAPGHSVAVTALEIIDFRGETVQKLYPDCALHGIVSPSTDLSREGIVAPTTQVDAGFFGTLNWTITNTSSDERRFLFGERIYRLTILRLERGEVPLKLYDGDYQGQRGYVRSQRKGAPVGIRDGDWESSIKDGGPEVMLDQLMKSGYPWHTLGQKLKAIDDQFKIVSDEYATIRDSLDHLGTETGTLSRKVSDEVESLRKKVLEDVAGLRGQHDEATRSIATTVSTAVKQEAESLQNRWLVSAGLMILGFFGVVLSVTSNLEVLNFTRSNGSVIGLVAILLTVIGLFIVIRRRGQ